MEDLRAKRHIPAEYILAPLAVWAALLALMTFTGYWPTERNSYRTYALQACAWLNGRLDLGRDYNWLELASYNGKIYSSFPPFPSVVLLPFAAIFGEHTPDHLISLAVTALGAVYAVRLCRITQKDGRGALFFALFLYLANGYLFIGLQGWVWFFAQCLCFTLSLMALTHAVQGQGGVALACWACAVGCRPMVVLYFPLLAYLLVQKEREKGLPCGVGPLLRRRWLWAVAPVALAAFYMALNVARFGHPLEFGRQYLPEFQLGGPQFSLHYVPGHIRELLAIPTADQPGGPLHYPRLGCIAFYMAAPMFISILAAWVYALVKKRSGNGFTLAALPIMAACHVLILCAHRTLGGWQFGNRYMLDLLPYLFYGMLRWKPEGESFAKLNAPLMAFGAAVNLIGAAAVYAKWI